ncbi:MAG: alpha/beta fold hydrolase [Anaerolineales bacterium]|nr:alpha/beta fold hydrolase [Anaerolineales bacterium]
MSPIPVSDGLTSRYIEVIGANLHILERGHADAPQKIVMIHGNIAAATWWEELMLALDPAQYHSVAIDLRGYGDSEATLPLDATRGMTGFADDINAVVESLGWGKHHYIGHSMGGSVGYAYVLEYSHNLLSVTLVAPGSPHGFGGTKDVEGNPCYDDYAGSGGGMGNPELIRMMGEGYRGTESPLSPRNALRNLVFKPPFVHPREEAILDALLATKLGEQFYPGDKTASPNWPMFAPGRYGAINGLSPKYERGHELASHTGNKPPILWVRGEADTIISNTSTSELGYLGKLGLVPGWPGEAVFPPQPMVDQTRAVLDKYKANGGDYQEIIFEGCGHSPQAEDFERFLPLFQTFIDQHQ